MLLFSFEKARLKNVILKTKERRHNLSIQNTILKQARELVKTTNHQSYIKRIPKVLELLLPFTDRIYTALEGKEHHITVMDALRTCPEDVKDLTFSECKRLGKLFKIASQAIKVKHGAGVHFNPQAVTITRTEHPVAHINPEELAVAVRLNRKFPEPDFSHFENSTTTPVKGDQTKTKLRRDTPHKLQ